MKKLLISLQIISTLSTLFSQDCGSPVDCYLKSIEALNRDRQEIRKLSDKIMADSVQLQQSVNKTIEEIKSKVINEYEHRIANLENKIIDLEAQISSLKESNANRNNLYKSSDAIIYHNIIEALEKEVISKLGNPQGWDEQTYRVNEWNKRKMIRIGTIPQGNGNGMKVVVPEGKNVLWLRVAEGWNIFRIASLDYPDDIIEKYDCSRRGLNSISPDGGVADGYSYVHKWCSFPLHKNGSYVVYTDQNTNGFISGIAFSNNLWNHASNSVRAYNWAINGGTQIPWESDNWNGDILARIDPGIISELIVPVIPSDKDKILYFIDHNNNWDSRVHTQIEANGVQLERLRTTYQNAFSTHINSAVFNRYIATRVPKEIIPKNSKFLIVKLDLTRNEKPFYIREIGTHDYIE